MDGPHPAQCAWAVFTQNLRKMTKSLVWGRVQTTWTEFWAILTPSPYVDTFTK